MFRFPYPRKMCAEEVLKVLKVQSMIGLAVFDVEDGKQLGKIHDFIITEDWSVYGFELEGKGLFSLQVRTVKWEDVVSCGNDAIMIRNQHAVRQKAADDIQHTFLIGNGKLKELPVLTGDGAILGYVSDVYFNPELGKSITGIEISDGFISDLIGGRKWLPISTQVAFGESAIMAPIASGQRLEECL